MSPFHILALLSCAYAQFSTQPILSNEIEGSGNIQLAPIYSDQLDTLTTTTIGYSLLSKEDRSNVSTLSPSTSQKEEIPSKIAANAIVRPVLTRNLEFKLGSEVSIPKSPDAGISVAPSMTKLVSKRAAEYYNGVLDARFYWSFSASRPTFPPAAVIGMGRPLQRGGTLPRTEYVVLWSPRGGAPHWGNVFLDDKLAVEGSFVSNGQIVNLTSPAMQGAPIRLLQYVGSQQSNNFKFSWVIARDVDPATVISQKQAGMCSPRTAPAVFQDGSFEFLGEADIDNRVMQYIYQGNVHIVEKAQFTNNVYLLTKQRCSCSC